VADLGIADIGQMAGARSGTDRGVFDLDIGSDQDIVGEDGTRANMAVRPDVAVPPDHALGRDRIRDDCPVADLHIIEASLRPDPAVFADNRLPPEDSARVDDRIAADLNHRVDPGRIRVDDLHAACHMPAADTAVQDLPGLFQLNPVVDAADLVEVCNIGTDLVAVPDQDLNRIGQVIFLLRVSGVDPAQCRKEERRAVAIDGRVDLADLFLLFCRVAVLHDLHDMARFVAHETAVALRVRSLRGDDHRGEIVIFKHIERGAQCLRRNNGGVARQDNRASVPTFEERRGLHDGMAGAKLLFLHDESDIFPKGGAHFLLPVSDDINLLLGARFAERVGYPADKGLSGGFLNHLRMLRMHPLSFARGHYYCTNIHADNLLYLYPV